MSIFNLNNWFNFFTPKNKRAKTLKDNDIIAFGRKDEKIYNHFRPLGITAKDLKEQFLGEVSPDTNNQTLEIAGEGDELALKNGSLNGNPVPDSVIPMEQIAQGFSLQDIGDVSAYSGNKNKFLKVNASGNGVEWVDDPSVINPTLNLRCNFGLLPSFQVLHNGRSYTGINVVRSGIGQYEISWNEDLIDEESTQVLVTSAGSPTFEQCAITSILPNSVGFKVVDLSGTPIDSGQFYIEIKEFPL